MGMLYGYTDSDYEHLGGRGLRFRMGLLRGILGV